MEGRGEGEGEMSRRQRNVLGVQKRFMAKHVENLPLEGFLAWG